MKIEPVTAVIGVNISLTVEEAVHLGSECERVIDFYEVPLLRQLHKDLQIREVFTAYQELPHV